MNDQERLQNAFWELNSVGINAPLNLDHGFLPCCSSCGADEYGAAGLPYVFCHAQDVEDLDSEGNIPDGRSFYLSWDNGLREKSEFLGLVKRTLEAEGFGVDHDGDDRRRISVRRTARSASAA